VIDPGEPVHLVVVVRALHTAYLCNKTPTLEK
jgi:hypothetical protein